MASDIRETPFVKELAANGTYLNSFPKFYCNTFVKISALVRILEQKEIEA